MRQHLIQGDPEIGAFEMKAISVELRGGRGHLQEVGGHESC